MHIIFRLLQRAKKIFLLYSASSEDFISSEPIDFNAIRIFQTTKP